jgi:hypothetical protein
VGYSGDGPDGGKFPQLLHRITTGFSRIGTVLAHNVGTDPVFRSALYYRIRYDLQQRFRRDRELSDKQPIMCGDNQSNFHSSGTG